MKKNQKLKITTDNIQHKSTNGARGYVRVSILFCYNRVVWDYVLLYPWFNLVTITSRDRFGVLIKEGNQLANGTTLWVESIYH